MIANTLKEQLQMEENLSFSCHRSFISICLEVPYLQTNCQYEFWLNTLVHLVTARLCIAFLLLYQILDQYLE